MNHRGHGGHSPPLPPSINVTTSRILRAALRVHTELGPSLLESVYETCLVHALATDGLSVARQVRVPITFEGVRLETGLRLDLVVDDSVLVELKAVSHITPVHHAQVLSYLKLSGIRVGLLLNLHVVHFRDGIRRLIL